MFMLHWW